MHRGVGLELWRLARVTGTATRDDGAERRRARNTLMGALLGVLVFGLAGHLMSGYVVAFAEWVER